jgi:hypothetical protein
VSVAQSNYQSELSAGNFAFAPSSGNYSADGDNFNMPGASSYTQKTSRKDYKYTGVVDSGTVTHAQFSQPAFKAGGTEGNEKPDQFSGPGYADTDFTIKKTTAIREGVSLQLRLDIFNLFNRVNLNASNLDTNYGDASAYFGTTTSNLPPRSMLVGARFDF